LLSEAEPGSTYSVASVYERDRKLLEFLEERGMRPGSSLQLLARNYDQTLTIKTANGTVSVGQPVAEKVWVSAAAVRPRSRAKLN
jgi:DtxR family Mn-dependent transcriptional regulator